VCQGPDPNQAAGFHPRVSERFLGGPDSQSRALKPARASAPRRYSTSVAAADPPQGAATLMATVLAIMSLTVAKRVRMFQFCREEFERRERSRHVTELPGLDCANSNRHARP